MEHVFLQRYFEPAISPDDVLAMARLKGDCLPLYRVAWHQSLLSVDGHRLFCHFEAPDTDAVRELVRGSGAAENIVWRGTIHDTGCNAVPRVAVERHFTEAADLDALQAVEDAAAGCLELHRVTFLRTFFSLDRLRMLCLYHAPDADSVRLAQQQAGMPVTRVWACRQVGQ